MRNKFITLSLFVILLFPSLAKAVCPVCTVGVVAGLGLSRWLGIDDTISGLWIGGVLMSISAWTITWLKSKKWYFKGAPFVITASYYAVTVVPLYIKEIIGHPFNTYWGLDKLVLGIILGSASFFFGALLYKYFKNKNGKAHFPFEKVVLPIAPLVVLSIIFYFLTK